jgi:hypothetical protein
MKPLLSAIALLFVSVAVHSIAAQFPMPVGPTGDRDRAESERDLEQRIASMRYLITLAEKRTPARKKDPKLALEELQEDFTRIQIVNKDLVLTSSRKEELSVKFVAKSATEIHKRAERLLANLALPELEPVSPPSKTQGISDPKQLKKAITSMGWRIYWFTKNPIFREAQVIEPTSAEKARRDLDAILEISSVIKKGCERLGKAARK